MIYDGHVHIMNETVNLDLTDLKMKMQRAGIDGGSVISYPPSDSYTGKSMTWEERLNQVLELTKDDENLFPVFYKL